jgi:hypothetical protein
VAGRDDALISGEQGRVLRTKDGGLTWEAQPTITSVSLFAVAYRGGADAWVAGRGGAILRRTSAVATLKIPAPKLPPVMRRAPKLQTTQQQQPDSLQTNVILDDDIPRAVQPDKKPE